MQSISKPQMPKKMQDKLKDIFYPMFETILQREMENHLAIKSKFKAAKTTKNRRNVNSKITDYVLKSNKGDKISLLISMVLCSKCEPQSV